jgi:glycosyltransferase involved in cell wall biosynthesis
VTVLKYALVTPARDEAANLTRLAESIEAQTLLPTVWVIVDNGSTDGTGAVAQELAQRLPWVALVNAPNEETRPGAPVVRAFNAGLAALRGRPDVVVKLDADVSFDPQYFSQLLDEFEQDSQLGIASGLCYELEDGQWRPRHSTQGHVRGAARAYRRACLDDVSPLPEGMGWDGVDELKASVLGWRTRTIDHLRFDQHRAVGERDGARTARWLAEGQCSHYMGYGPAYLIARTLGRAIRDRDLAVFAMPWAYLRCALRREPRYPDEAVRAYLRRQQSVRHLPARMLESFGRKAA